MNDIIVISGGFDPIHSGHIDLIRSSAKFGKIVVLLNSNAYRKVIPAKYLLQKYKRIQII